ncbi:MAG: hypothetical protein H0T83_04190, partial [Chthoniobacterales bacterium]|nr:hypothetical protein [Chthoniobacterales bacterium]
MPLVEQTVEDTVEREPAIAQRLADGGGEEQDQGTWFAGLSFRAQGLGQLADRSGEHALGLRELRLGATE